MQGHRSHQFLAVDNREGEEKVSDDLIVTLPRGDMYNINLIHLIEQALNKALDPIGFTLTGTTKGKEVVLKFHQFGIAIDREEQP